MTEWVTLVARKNVLNPGTYEASFAKRRFSAPSRSLDRRAVHRLTPYGDLLSSQAMLGNPMLSEEDLEAAKSLPVEDRRAILAELRKRVGPGSTSTLAVGASIYRPDDYYRIRRALGLEEETDELVENVQMGKTFFLVLGIVFGGVYLFIYLVAKFAP